MPKLQPQQQPVLQEFDVVVFNAAEQSIQQQDASSASLAVGCVTWISGNKGVAHIEELVPDDETDHRPGFRAWVEVGCEHVVPVASVMRVLDAEFTERIDADRVANPHGEHAHNVFELSELLDLSQEMPPSAGGASEI